MLNESSNNKNLTQNQYSLNGLYTWMDALWAVIPLLVAMVTGFWILDPIVANILIKNHIFINGINLSFIIICSGMAWLAIYRKRLILEVWWLSWSLFFLGDALYGMFHWGNWTWNGQLRLGLWLPVLLFELAILLLLGFRAVRQLWRSRKNGLLLSFFAVPWIFSLFPKGMLYLDAWVNPSFERFRYNDFFLMSLDSPLDFWVVMKILVYLILAIAVMLIHQRQSSWLLFLICIAVFVAATIFLWPISFLARALFSLAVFVPMLLGVWIDFKNHNLFSTALAER